MVLKTLCNIITVIVQHPLITEVDHHYSSILKQRAITHNAYLTVYRLYSAIYSFHMCIAPPNFLLFTIYLMSELKEFSLYMCMVSIKGILSIIYNFSTKKWYFINLKRIVSTVCGAYAFYSFFDYCLDHHIWAQESHKLCCLCVNAIWDLPASS